MNTTAQARRLSIASTLQEKLEEILLNAEREDSLDYFKIELTNHNGNIQVDYKFRERFKVY
jgi:hypothetical protein